MRRVILALVVAGLAAVVWLLWPDAAEDETPEPEAAISTTTTSTQPASTTITGQETTTTTGTTIGPETHVVETVEEAEEILRQLWFGWFEGIYNQDEERIREVVVNPILVENAQDQFGEMEFADPPTADAIVVSDVEILRSDKECLAAWGVVSAEFREGSVQGVHVFGFINGEPLLINTWPLREDLWESDCGVVLPSS